MRRVADIMTRDIFPLKAKQTLNVVRLLMRTVRVRHVPILDDDERFVGLLSHRDLLAYSIHSSLRIHSEDLSYLPTRTSTSSPSVSNSIVPCRSVR